MKSLAGATVLAGLPLPAFSRPGHPRFRYCLGQYSLHRTLSGEQGPRLDPLDYPAFAKKTFSFEAVDYWSGPFQDKVGDAAYLKDMARRAGDAGVQGILILVDGVGRIGDPDAKARSFSVDEHSRWLVAAKILGCFAIRVNAHSEGPAEEQLRLCADGISRLCEKAKAMDLEVLVENHGGLSSDGSWSSALMKEIRGENHGTLPDFGNFYEYDRYKGVEEMMPYARLVCAKSRDFNLEGNETGIDYVRMLDIVSQSGYKGWIEIEYEGGGMAEIEGVRATLKLLDKVLE